MSALTMVLMAAMVVPGNGREKVSAEIAHGLDLSKKWEGALWTKQGEVCLVRIDRKVILIESDGGAAGFSTSRLVDLGGGKLLFRGQPSLYRQEDDLLLIRVGEGDLRPLSIGAKYGHLFILHRVKPPK